jgi:hypothetical protein
LLDIGFLFLDAGAPVAPADARMPAARGAAARDGPAGGIESMMAPHATGSAPGLSGQPTVDVQDDNPALDSALHQAQPLRR